MRKRAGQEYRQNLTHEKTKLASKEQDKKLTPPRRLNPVQSQQKPQSKRRSYPLGYV
jgi:hypothetical protein